MKFCNPKKQQEKSQALIDFEAFLGASVNPPYCHTSSLRGVSQIYVDTINDLYANSEYIINASNALYRTNNNIEVNQQYNTISSADINSAFNQFNTLDSNPRGYAVYMSPTQYASWTHSIDNDINNNLNTI